MAVRLVLVVITLLGILGTSWLTTTASGAREFLDQSRLTYDGFLWFVAIWALGGGVVSWIMAKDIAKWGVNVTVLSGAQSEPRLEELRECVMALASKAGLPEPEVGTYPAEEANAFAVGRTRKDTLVAVSTGALDAPREAREGIIAQAIAGANAGDVQTGVFLLGMTYGFTLYPARLFALLMGTAARTSDEETPSEIGESVICTLFDLFFTVGGSLVAKAYVRFSHRRMAERAEDLVGADKVLRAMTLMSDNARKSGTHDRMVAPMKVWGKRAALPAWGAH